MVILGQWEPVSQFRQPRAGHQSVAVGDHLYVLGGYSSAARGGSGKVVLFNDVQYASLKQLFAGVLPADGWRKSTPFSGARSGHGCVAYGGRIYIIGGGDGIKYFSDVQYAAIRNDGAIDSRGWLKSENHLNLARSAHGCGVFVNNGTPFIYVAGGAGSEVGKTVHYDSVEYAPIHEDGHIGNWTLCNSRFSEGRAHCGLAFVDDRIYVIGGWGDYDVYSDIQYAPIMANGTLGNWITNIATLNPSRFGHATVVWQNEPLTAVIIIGGVFATGMREGYSTQIDGRSSQSRYLGDVQFSCFTSEGTDPWIPLSEAFDITPTRWGHTSVLCGKQLLVMGGQSESGEFLNDVLITGLEADFRTLDD